MVDLAKVFRLVFLFVALLSLSFSSLLLLDLDSLVHGQFYSFGLQFSMVWASPYWNLLRLVFAFNGAVAACLVLLITSELVKLNRKEVGVLCLVLSAVLLVFFVIQGIVW